MKLTLKERKQVKEYAKKLVEGRLFEDNTNRYKTELNSILEDEANKELMSKLNAKDYNNFFTCLQKLDNKASDAAMEIGDSYFPIDELSQGIEYLENYLKYFGNSQCKTFMMAILKKIK